MVCVKVQVWRDRAHVGLGAKFNTGGVRHENREIEGD